MLSTQKFQTLLLRNGGDIIDNIDPEEIHLYHLIKQNLHKTNLAEDEDFQADFAYLYKLSGRRYNAKLMKRFFQLLEKEKEHATVNIRQTSRKLFGIRPKVFRQKHFSLLTQFLHSLHENYPIYDKEVAELFADEVPTNNKIPFYRKANLFFRNYDKTLNLYKEVLSKGKLYDLIRVIELKFKPFKESLSHSKNLDLLVRSAGDLKRKGQLLNPGNHIFLGTI
ncbi:MAG: hypothetical protein AAFR87_14390 [Bacteroidota bacterium]